MYAESIFSWQRPNISLQYLIRESIVDKFNIPHKNSMDSSQ